MKKRKVLLQAGYSMLGPAELPGMIQLKLRKRWFRELADVVRLISAFELDESFLNHLPPEHHAKFLELLDEKRRDDEFHAREL